MSRVPWWSTWPGCWPPTAAIGTPRRSRALGPFRQAVLVTRWFRQGGCVHGLARDAGVCQATGYRYLHEGIEVLADAAPDLHQVLTRCRQQGMAHVVLDGTLVACDRVAGLTADGNDAWYSGKHKRFGGNVQFLAAPDGRLLWVSDVEPGSAHDIVAARAPVLPALVPCRGSGLAHPRRRRLRRRRDRGGHPGQEASRELA